MEKLLSEQAYSSFSRRLLAFLIDGLILTPLCAIGGHIIPVLGAVLVLILYAPVLESSRIQATIGKHLMGIQVCDLDGRRLSLQTAIFRNLLKYVSVSLCFIPFLFALLSARRQTLHDMIAHTLVIYGRSDAPIAQAWTDSARDVFEKLKSPVPTAEVDDSHDSARGSSSTTHSNRSSSDVDVVSQLERLQALREKGVINDIEFAEQKRKILG